MTMSPVIEMPATIMRTRRSARGYAVVAPRAASASGLWRSVPPAGLPAGAAHTQPSELLGSAPMRRLLDGLRRHFDRVVVDTGAAQSADTGALEPCLDGLLVVVRAGRTDRPSIERALTAIPSAKLVGLVLNDIRTDSAPGA